MADIIKKKYECLEPVYLSKSKEMLTEKYGATGALEYENFILEKGYLKHDGKPGSLKKVWTDKNAQELWTYNHQKIIKHMIKRLSGKSHGIELGAPEFNEYKEEEKIK